jgi:EF-P beta-lysylation protein EpmB
MKPGPSYEIHRLTNKFCCSTLTPASSIVHPQKMTILSAPLPVVRPRFAVPRYASWQEALKDAVRDPDELCRLLDLPPDTARAARLAARQFPLFAPRGFVARMRPGDANDPLLRQVLPLPEELIPAAGFVVDPVDDFAAVRQPGLLQKYRGRVLFITTGTCAVHCRYCFRRNFPYDEAPRSIEDWRPAIDEIAEGTSVHEVILSGGDPLTLVDAALEQLVARLAAVPHLRRLRVHTRLPIVIPERVTEHLIAMLRDCGLTPIVVVHSNHANELDAHVATALAKLTNAGIVLLNQAVLLAGVNDSVEAQAALCERLVDLRVLPYYLHQLDRVSGAAHFEVPVDRGRKIVESLRDLLPGYAVPRYVAEIAGEASKSIIA